MKIAKEIVKEESAFDLRYSDYNTTEYRKVSWRELKESKIGTEFCVDVASSCGRACDETTATLVYRDDTGCAVVFHHFGTTDEPNPDSWKDDPILQWFEFEF